MATPLGLLDYNWCNTAESAPYLNPVLNRKGDNLRKFGYLERPQFDAKLKELSYKIIVSGKSGCGKTSTIMKLAGHDVSRTYKETPGIEQTTLYWPARLKGSREPVLFKLKFCDAGETATTRFDHILPAMKENADGVIFFFSMVDRSSFEDIAQQMSRLLDDRSANLSKLVIATKLDQHGKSEVPQRELQEFERQYNIPIVGISNVSAAPADPAASELRVTAPILNCICERLWYRDQQEAGLVI